MEVEYEITYDDLFAFQWCAGYESRRARRSRRTSYLYLFVLLSLLIIVPSIASGGFVISAMSLTFLAIPFIIGTVIQWLLIRWMTRKAIVDLLKDEKPDKGHLGMHRVVLDESGVVETTAVGESRTSWVGVDRVEQNGEYIFVYTTPNAAHLIPKRAFKTVQEAKSFYELARISLQTNQPLLNAGGR